MGRKKKFDKIGRNETYYAAYGDETQQDEKKESSTKKEKKKTLFDIDPGNVPEKKEPSSKFKYKKEKRKAVEEAQPVEEVEAPSKAPLVLALISFSIILLMQAFVQSGLLAGLSNSMKTTASLVFYAIAYIVPVVIYMIINYSRIKFHNIRWFSFSHIPFAVACLGFAVAATALQKYAIAYSSSYSMGLHDIMNTERRNRHEKRFWQKDSDYPAAGCDHRHL